MKKSNKKNKHQLRKVVKKKINKEMSKDDKIYIFACSIVIIFFLLILAFNFGKCLVSIA